MDNRTPSAEKLIEICINKIENTTALNIVNGIKTQIE